MAESIQKRLTRERPPRVKITYDVETGNAIVKTELPFVMGVIGDLSGERKNVDRSVKTVMRNGKQTALPVNWQDYQERAFVEIDKDNFNDVLAEFAPRLPYKPGDVFKAALESKGITLTEGAGTFVFNNLDDFTPDNLVFNVKELNRALTERDLVRDLYTKMDTNETLLRTCFCFITDVKMTTVDANKQSGQVEVTDEITNEAIAKAFSVTMAPQVSDYLKRRKDGLGDLLYPSGIEKPVDDTAANPRFLIKVLIAEVADIDRIISGEMNRILHDADFQKLESAWRGLFYLVRNTATGTGLKLKVLNANEDELYRDLTDALDFDQSRLFKMIYEETYGTQGGAPYSCLLHAHYYGKSDRSILLATQMTAVAAAAHAPLLAAPSPELFNLDSFRELAGPRDLAKIFESAEHLKWKSLRESEDSRYLAMCMPRILMRAPYTRGDIESFEYEEAVGVEIPADNGAAISDTANPDHEKYLWGNAAYALGACITRAFELYGWTAAIRGMEGGGLVEELPLHSYTRASGDIVTKIPTETAITDRREKELSDLGFISLCYRLGTDKAVFFGGQTVNKPIKYMEADATANANLSARLPYILNASRFAHYVKSIMRDKVGSFLDRESVENFLNNWMSSYVLLSDNATQNIKASYPLREGRVDVTADGSNPGVYSAIMYLRPHYQLEELSVSIRLVATLPAPAA